MGCDGCENRANTDLFGTRLAHGFDLEAAAEWVGGDQVARSVSALLKAIMLEISHRRLMMAFSSKLPLWLLTFLLDYYENEKHGLFRCRTR